MSENNYLEELGKQIESLFDSYDVTFIYDSDDDVRQMNIHSSNNIFFTPFLHFLYERLQGWLFCFECDDTGRPVINIYVYLDLSL